MDRILPLLSATFFLSFAVCCTASALLQAAAWSRHRLEGRAVNLGAVWKPEGYFDEIGLRQMRLARRMILVGVVAYLSYGVLMLVATGVDARH